MSHTNAQRVELQTADGPMHAYVAKPDAGGRPAPGILVFQEAFGVNAYMRDVTERFARLGMIAIAPELFHRTADGFDAAYGDMDAVLPHLKAVTADGIAQDARAAYDWLKEREQADRISAIGFCMGGRAAYVANAHLQLRAAISFYGGGIAADLLPLAARQHAPLLMFWGGKDSHIPPDQYRAVADALSAAGKPHEQVVFSEAGHGFFCDARESYDPSSSAQAWSLVQSFLRQCGAGATTD